MPTVDYLRLMATYNRWFNGRLYELCAGLSDRQRKENRGAFFGSIHGTLNHILLADRVWLGRLSAEPFKVTSLAQELYSDFGTLAAEREKTDAALHSYVVNCQVSELHKPFPYRNTAGTEKTFPLFVVLTHVFNHQTHHRGQVTTLLSQFGIDIGATDIIAMPGL